MNQRETIEKSLIEAQNQPSLYYTRRNNRRGPQSANANNGVSFHNSGNMAHGRTGINHNNQNLGYVWNQGIESQAALMSLAPSTSNMSMMGVDVYGYRNNTNNFSGSGAPGVVHVPQIFDDLPVTKPSVSLVSLALGSARNASDGSLVEPGSSGSPVRGSLLLGQNGSGGVLAGNSGLSTFDPFSERDQMWLFNSSNNILGGSFTPSTTNIWGDNSKTDAAVWG